MVRKLDQDGSKGVLPTDLKQRYALRYEPIQGVVAFSYVPLGNRVDQSVIAKPAIGVMQIQVSDHTGSACVRIVSHER